MDCETKPRNKPARPPDPRPGAGEKFIKDWFRRSLGQSIVQAEIEQCGKLIPAGYYANGLQIGMPIANYFRGVEVGDRFVVDTMDSYQPRQRDAGLPHCHHVVSTSEAIPFPEKSHDLVILPHTLDFCGNTYEVLRQSNQVLAAEGCMVIAGFNLVSLYGALSLLKNRGRETPWSGKFYTVGRVQDWLSLLGFDLVGAGMISYQLPTESESWRQKTRFIEKAGNRWWPGLGGVYVIVGRKREIGVTPLVKPRKTWHQLLPSMAQPASQRAARAHLKLVSRN